MTTREDDDWVQLAMVNDAVVVDLLIQIHQAAPPRIKSTSSDPLPLDWTVRQPRSKPLFLNNNNNNNNNNKLLPLPLSTTSRSRSSPTTPLSWSGVTATATSFSGGGSADGVEESSSRPQPHLLAASRSKISGAGIGTTLSKCKRPRKKKSLNELKEEENLLNKERRHLKKELAALRMDIEKQRGINQNLKRLKVEKQTVMATSFSQNEMGSQKINNCFHFLPDLNIACSDHENL